MFPEIALPTNVEIVARSRHLVGAPSDAVGTGSFQAAIFDVYTDVWIVRVSPSIDVDCESRSHSGPRGIRSNATRFRNDAEQHSGGIPNTIPG
jgi:hypothetical protein